MTSTDFDPSSAAVGPDISGLVATALSPVDKTTALTKVRYLERELLDDDGHVRKGMTAARADEIVDLINELRRALGWLEIDLAGRWRWPASTRGESRSSPTRRLATN